jgi:hypothetical protein
VNRTHQTRYGHDDVDRGHGIGTKNIRDNAQEEIGTEEFGVVGKKGICVRISETQ